MKNRQPRITAEEIQTLRKKFSVKELTAIILLRFYNNVTKKEELEQRVAEEAYSPINFPSYDALGGKIRDLTAEWLSKAYATKLKAPKYRGAFLSDDDYLKCVGYVMRTIGSNRSDTMYRSAFFLGAVYLKDSFKEVKSQIASVEDPEYDPYEENWRWIKAVIEEAESWELLPSEVLRVPLADDGVFRRLFSREDFIQYCERSFRFYYVSGPSIKKYIEKAARTYVENLGLTGAEKEQVRKAFIERELEVSERMDIQLAQTINDWIKTETERIYG